MKLAMTPGWLDRLRPADKPVEHRDLTQRGLVLRVEVSGRKSWVARYTFGGRERRYAIGTYPEVSLKAARKEAQRKRGAASLGTDPQLQRDRLRIGGHVFAAVEAWLEDPKLGPVSRWKGGLSGGADCLKCRRGTSNGS
jgi:hypothetical protein